MVGRCPSGAPLYTLLHIDKRLLGAAECASVAAFVLFQNCSSIRPLVLQVFAEGNQFKERNMKVRPITLGVLLLTTSCLLGSAMAQDAKTVIAESGKGDRCSDGKHRDRQRIQPARVVVYAGLGVQRCRCRLMHGGPRQICGSSHEARLLP